MFSYNDDMVTYTTALFFDLLVDLIHLRSIILCAVIVVLILKRFAWDFETAEINSHDDGLLDSTVCKEASRDPSPSSHADRTRYLSRRHSVHTDSRLDISVESDSQKTGRLELIETDAVAVDDDAQTQKSSAFSVKEKHLTVETQTSVDEEPDTTECNPGRRDSTEDIRKRLRQPSCRCKRPNKSASMSEADVKTRSQGAVDPNNPVSVTYYYGKLIQVNSSSQVQIGDRNTMELNLSQRKEPVASTEEDVEEEEPEVEVILDEESEADGDITHICSECRARLTDDEKSLLPPLNSSLPGEDGVDDHSQTDGAFDESSQHSCDTSDVTTSTSCLYSSDEDTDELMSPARRLRSRTCPASDEEKEQIFVEARIKIYNATREHRRHTHGQIDQAARKSFRNILKRKKNAST